MPKTWELGDVHSPHDIALSAAPVAATLGGSRSLAVYVAETAKGHASHLHKFIIHAPGAPEPQMVPLNVSPCLVNATIKTGSSQAGVCGRDR